MKIILIAFDKKEPEFVSVSEQKQHAIFMLYL